MGARVLNPAGMTGFVTKGGGRRGPGLPRGTWGSHLVTGSLRGRGWGRRGTGSRRWSKLAEPGLQGAPRTGLFQGGETGGSERLSHLWEVTQPWWQGLPTAAWVCLLSPEEGRRDPQWPPTPSTPPTPGSLGPGTVRPLTPASNCTFRPGTFSACRGEQVSL